jgi:sugar lactone lactonase YvrE
MTVGWLLAVDGGFAGLAPDGHLHAVLNITGGPARPRLCQGTWDPVGRFFAGTETQDRERGTGALYRVDVDGGGDIALTGLTVPTGVA